MDKLLYKVACYSDSFFLLFFHLLLLLPLSPSFIILSHTQEGGLFPPPCFSLISHCPQRGLKPPGTNRAPLPQAIPA